MNPPPLPPRPNPVARFFVGLWDVMNFTRRLILNLLFFGLLLLVLIVFLAAVGKGSSGVVPVHERTTLVIAPEGRLVEQYTTDPLTRAVARALGDTSAEEVQLRDLLRAIEAARGDKNIERVLLNLDKLQPAGMASTREVAQALGG
nr:signal peptide peptidase SppA [Pseudoxanthomonas sp.]